MTINKTQIWILVAVVVLGFAAAYIFGRAHTSPVLAPTASAENFDAPQEPRVGGSYDYTEAPKHIGENATITGTVVEVFTSKTNTTFFDYCKDYSSCPFSVVIFSDDAAKFGNLKSYQGKHISITGLIKSYQGHAEMILSDPSQIH